MGESGDLEYEDRMAKPARKNHLPGLRAFVGERHVCAMARAVKARGKIGLSLVRESSLLPFCCESGRLLGFAQRILVEKGVQGGFGTLDTKQGSLEGQEPLCM